MPTKMTDVDVLLAERNIMRLLAAYAQYLDDGRFTDISELMAHAKYSVLDSTVNGRDEVEAFLTSGVQRHANDTPRTWHSISNVLIDIALSGDSASSTSYFIVHQELNGFPLQPICTGLYEDTFQRANDKWRFATRIVRPRLFGDITRHVRAPSSASQV